MARIIYWAVLLAILAELAALLYYGGTATAGMLQNDIGIGFDGAVAALMLLFVAVIAKRVIGRFFPQPQWQQPQPPGQHWGGQ
jgi:hypothetical protein